MQPYLRSPVIKQKEAQTISAPRSKCVRSVHTNFSKMYKNRIDCFLQCNKEAPQVDTQEHLLTCSRIKIQNPDSIRIQDVFEDLTDQEHCGDKPTRGNPGPEHPLTGCCIYIVYTDVRTYIYVYIYI